MLNLTISILLIIKNLFKSVTFYLYSFFLINFKKKKNFFELIRNCRDDFKYDLDSKKIVYNEVN